MIAASEFRDFIFRKVPEFDALLLADSCSPFQALEYQSIGEIRYEAWIKRTEAVRKLSEGQAYKECRFPAYNPDEWEKDWRSAWS